MGEDGSDAAPGPIGRLLRSAGGFLAGLLAIARTRLELLGVEVQLEVRRVASLLVLGLASLLAAGMALLMAGLAVIFAFWDSHRVLAAVGVTATFLVLAVVSAAFLARRLRAGPRPLEGTLAELARDIDQLRGRG